MLALDSAALRRTEPGGTRTHTYCPSNLTRCLLSDIYVFQLVY